MYDECSPIYIYECSICKKEIKISHVWKCLICKKKVCSDCYRDNFCLDHYNMLSSKGKEKLIDLVKNYEKQDHFLENLMLSIGLMLAILFGISLSIIFATNNFIWFFPCVVFTFVLYFIFMIIFVNKQASIYEKTESDKICLYFQEKKEEN